MTRNAELLNRLADHFEARPETWRQGLWGVANECGTYACIAGWACIFTYGEAAFTRKSNCANPRGHLRIRTFLDGDFIQGKAAKILGFDALTDDQADLFDSGWEPAPELGLPGALRALANGATVDEVSA